LSCYFSANVSRGTFRRLLPGPAGKPQQYPPAEDVNLIKQSGGRMFFLAGVYPEDYFVMHCPALGALRFTVSREIFFYENRFLG
jgi:hypothetical protein